ncbi:hypothetical protein P9Z80_30225 [Bacillus cereus]|nr:hypothetical protein [Bacillus cereus]MEC3259309.1 hypothetical protein [Bacillus cereus]
MSKITCQAYPDKDYLDFNDNELWSDGLVDLRVHDSNGRSVISLDVKRMKKLRKQLKKYIKEIEEHERN